MNAKSIYRIGTERSPFEIESQVVAVCMVDRHVPELITHTLAEIIRFRLLVIGASYEDGNDASSLRSDLIFKKVLDLSPFDRELCSQWTISRLNNLPDA